MSKEDDLKRAQGKRLADARKAAGYRSARAAAVENEWPESSYRAHEAGTRTIGQDDAERYAQRFGGVSATHILFGTAFSASFEPPTASKVAQEARAFAAQEPIPGDQIVGDNDLPIYASARGGPEEDSMIISNEAIEYVRRPSPLIGVKGAYGVYVVGDSMSPVYEPGDMALVHPYKPPRPGDDVIVIGASEDDDGHFGLIKRLVRQTNVEWTLKQFNPPPGMEEEFRLNRFDWRVCHLVVGSYKRR